MPTVLRIGGLRVVIYPNDHPPAHVPCPRTRVAGGVAINCSEHEARKVLRLIEDRQAELMDAWRRFHD